MIELFGTILGATCGLILLSLMLSFFTDYDRETKPFLFFRALMWLSCFILVFESMCFGVWILVKLVLQAIL